VTKRPSVPKKNSDEVLASNRHTCCICREPRKHVQLHHIDGNASNNAPSNLAVLCLDCHSIVTGDAGLGRSYSVREVSIYKQDWEKTLRQSGDFSTRSNETALASQVFELVRRLQARNERLSLVMAQTLEAAQELGAQDITDMCRHKLSGWRKKREELEKPLPAYRMCPCYVSPYKLEIECGPWGGRSSTIWRYMESNPDKFVRHKVFLTLPIDTLEQAADRARENTQAVAVIKAPSELVQPQSLVKGVAVYFYISHDALLGAMDAIRSELTHLLLDLRP